MTLNLDWKDVRDYENVCEMDDPERPGHRTNRPITFVLGMLMMHTGISSITEKNADEFYCRAKLIEACFDGGFMQRPVKYKGSSKFTVISVGITAEDVYAHIGMKSNVSRYTEAEFFRHLRNDVVSTLRQHYRAIARQHDEANEAALRG